MVIMVVHVRSCWAGGPLRYCHKQSTRLTASEPTLYFMPHCELSLYEQVWAINATAGTAANVLMFGNCLDNYTIRYVLPIPLSLSLLSIPIYSLAPCVNRCPYYHVPLSLAHANLSLKRKFCVRSRSDAELAFEAPSIAELCTYISIVFFCLSRYLELG